MQRITVFWRDIPAQVIVKRGRERGKALLSSRFQHAVDRAAMRAGRGGSEEYLNDWRRVSESIESGESPQHVAEQAAAALEQRYGDEDLARLVKSFGLEDKGKAKAGAETEAGAEMGEPANA